MRGWARPGCTTLPPVSTADWYLLLHLVGAFALVGGAAVATAGLVAARSERPAGGASVLAVVARRGVRMLLAPGALIALVFGILLAEELGYSLGEGWISASFVLWIALMLAAEFMVARSAGRIEDAAAEDPASAAAVARAVPVAAGLLLVNLLALALIVLMVWRPGS